MQRNSNEELPEPQANYTISDQAREVEQLATSSLAQHEAAFAILVILEETAMRPRLAH